MDISVIIVVVIVTALAFDFTNGFHDTANAVATSIATGALKPRTAVLIAGVLNLVGAFLSVQVAKTISSGLVDDTKITPTVIFAGLVGAIVWNLLTWLVGLPSSSSHALIGGLIGATWVAAGADAVKFAGLVGKVLLPAVLAPIIAGVIALIATHLAYRITARAAQGTVTKGFKLGQIVSGSMVALAHGTNDAPEDHGHHHAHPDHRRRAARGRGPAVLGHPLLGSGDRARHLYGWVADHPDPRHARQRDRDAAGVRRRDQQRHGHPHLLAPGLPAVHHAGRHRLDLRRRGGSRGRVRALGHRRAGRLRVAADAARGRGVRRLSPPGWRTPARSARSSSPSCWSASRAGSTPCRVVARSPPTTSTTCPRRRSRSTSRPERRNHMTINWGALGVVAVVSLVIGVLIVVLVSLALVGLSAREPDATGRAGRRGTCHRSHRQRPVTRRRHGDCRGLPARCGHHRRLRALPSRLLTERRTGDGRTAHYRRCWAWSRCRRRACRGTAGGPLGWCGLSDLDPVAEGAHPNHHSELMICKPLA